MIIQGQRVPGRGNSKCKGPEAGQCLVCPETAKRPGWTDESEPEGEWEECEGRKGIGHIL